MARKLVLIGVVDDYRTLTEEAVAERRIPAFAAEDVPSHDLRAVHHHESVNRTHEFGITGAPAHQLRYRQCFQRVRDLEIQIRFESRPGGDRPGSDRRGPGPRAGARGPMGGNVAPADGSDKPAEATGGAPAQPGADSKPAVKRVRKAAPAAAADGAKTE